MTPATRNGLGAAGAGLTLGLSADLLLTVEPWGLNLALCVAGLVAAGFWIVRRAVHTPAPDAGWLALTGLLLGAAFVRRDAEFLQVLDFGTLVVVSALAALAARGTPVRGGRLGAYVAAFFTSAGDAIIGGPRLVLGDIAWGELPVRRLGPIKGVALGAVIALPLLFVFGALFAGADPVFSQTMSGVFDFDLGRAVAHAVRTGILGSMAAGYLRGLTAEPRILAAPVAAKASVEPTDRVIPTVTALVLLDALFLVFVVFQLGYFFGGAARIQQITSLTYAEYARHGFFELLGASALVVPLLLGAEWLVRGADPAPLRRFRLAASAMLGLLAVVVASALERMRLYVDAYGLTEDRLYATAAMLFLVLVLAWLGWTVLRGRGERFAFGAFVQGLAVLAGLHVVNPDAFILRHNLARPGAERPFDIKYVSALSADAAPVLFEALPQLTPADACVAARQLAAWGGKNADWRTWNWSRSRAAHLARDARVTDTIGRCAPVPTPTPGT